MDDLERYLGEKQGEEDWSDNTVSRYRHIIKKFLEETEETEGLGVAGLRKWLGSNGWGNSAQYVACSAVKGYLAWKYGRRHKALKTVIKRRKGPRQRSLDMDQVRRLLEYFDTGTAQGRRDLALACLFLDSGLRVSEMCRLELRYLDIPHQSLVVKIKGGNWGEAWFSPPTASYLTTWLADRERVVASGVRTVFVSVGGPKAGNALTRDGLKVIVRKWGRESGIGMLSPHDFRRTFATEATRRGASERILMEAGRWSSSAMIKRYTPAIRPEDLAPFSVVVAALER